MAEIKALEGLDEGVTASTVGDLRRKALLDWIMQNVQTFEEERDRGDFEESMSRYYHIWRGKYDPSLKTRKSEWSKLIHPATSAAIDNHVAEVESATIDNDYFMVLQDDDDQSDLTTIEKKLRTDLKNPKAGVQDALSALILIGGIYGEAGAEAYLDSVPQMAIRQGPGGEAVVERGQDKKVMRLNVLLPNQLIYDTGAPTFEDSLGVGSRTYVPLHAVQAKQADGIWREDVEVKAGTVKNETLIDPMIGPSTEGEFVELIKWDGKVPAGYLPDAESDEALVVEDPSQPELQKELDVDETDLVEARVVIANETDIMFESTNKTLLQERMFMYYRPERVPGSLRGRGVAEKAHSPQSSLDGMMRANMEASAKTVHPIFGINGLMKGRGFKFSQRPGAVMEVQGDPSQVIKRIDLGGVSPELFANTTKLEELVAVATNTFDSSAMNNVGSVAAQGGASMAITSFVKRTKRAVRNFNEDILMPFVTLAAHMLMQFDPENYKPTDVTFTAAGSMGALAREVEQANAMNIMKTVPVQSPGWWVLFRAVMMNSNFQDRDDMVLFAEQQLQAAANPQQSELEKMQIAEIQNKIQNQSQDTRTNLVRALAETARVSLEMVKSDDESAKLKSEAILNLAKAEAEEVGKNMNQYKTVMDLLTVDAKAQQSASGVFPNEEIQVARAASLGGADQLT